MKLRTTNKARNGFDRDLGEVYWVDVEAGVNATAFGAFAVPS